jgi:hypothetical protein
VIGNHRSETDLAFGENAPGDRREKKRESMGCLTSCQPSKTLQRMQRKQSKQTADRWRYLNGGEAYQPRDFHYTFQRALDMREECVLRGLVGYRLAHCPPQE